VIRRGEGWVGESNLEEGEGAVRGEGILLRGEFSSAIILRKRGRRSEE